MDEECTLRFSSDAASAKEELQLVAVRFSSLDDAFGGYISHRQKFERRHLSAHVRSAFSRVSAHI